MTVRNRHCLGGAWLLFVGLSLLSQTSAVITPVRKIVLASNEFGVARNTAEISNFRGGPLLGLTGSDL